MESWDHIPRDEQSGFICECRTCSFVLTIPYVLSRKIWVQAIVLIILDLLLEANLMYCRTYFTAIPLDSYFLAGNLKDFTASIWDSLRWSDISLAIITVAVLLAASKGQTKKQKLSIRQYAALTILFGCISWGLAMVGGGYKRQIGKMEESCYYATCIAPVYTVFGNLIYQGTQAASASLSQEDVIEIEDWLNTKNEVLPYNALPDSFPVVRIL